MTFQFSAISPDGAIRFLVLPLRAFIAFENQMSQQAAIVAAQQGGCQVYPPFNAARYLQNLARNSLGGATVTDVRDDESLRAVIAKISEMTNATAQQYGNGMSQSGSGVYGTLTWPDGSKGLAQVGVSVMTMLCLKSTNHTWIGSVQGAVATWSNHQSPKSFANIACRSLTRSLPLPVLTRSKNDFRLLRQSFMTKQGRDMYTGAANGFATTTVFSSSGHTLSTCARG